MSSYKHGQGFTLIELMVVVSIIGILSVLAYNGFRKYRLESYRTQVKSEMADLYGRMNQFRLTFGSYFGDFRNIAYAPEGPFVFRIGFDGSGLGATLPAGYGGPGVIVPGGVAVEYDINTYCAGGGAGQCTVNAASTCALSGANLGGVAANFAVTSFLAGACRNFPDGGVDSWTIDQNRNLVHQRVYE